jgi:hypothetical protein
MLWLKMLAGQSTTSQFRQRETLYMGRDAVRPAMHRRVTPRASAMVLLTIATIVGLTFLDRGPTGAMASTRQQAPGLRFEISFPTAASRTPQTGHIILVVSKDTGAEPRFQYKVYSPDVQPGFGLDVESLAPGQTAVIDRSTLGWPLTRVDDLPAGDYRVQAVLNRYETFRLANGHTIELPPDKGEGQHWFSKPGNFYSAPLSVHLDPAVGQTIRLNLDRVIPSLTEPKDTKWVRYVRIKSDLLSKFWGRPMYLGAIVLLPAGYDDHPAARYPLAVDQGHFPTGLASSAPTRPRPTSTAATACARPTGTISSRTGRPRASPACW